MPCVEGSNQLWRRPGPQWSALLFAETTSESHRGDNDGMRAHTGPTVAGWAPVLASPNLRHAFALISDEVDASLSGIRLTVLVRPDSELARVLVWRLYEYMPQLVLVSEPVTSSRPALHRVPKVSNAFIKKLAVFTLWCFVRRTATAEFSQLEAELRTDYFRLRCRPGSASGWSRRSNRPSCIHWHGCIKRNLRYETELVESRFIKFMLISGSICSRVHGRIDVRP
jgi:hypothetical protein